MNKKKIKIALCQLLVEGGEPERNLNRAIELINKATTEKVDIVLLPECMDLGWTHPSAHTSSQPIPGKYFNTLSEQAKKNNLFICAGLTEKDNKYKKNYNTAVLIDNNGNLILKYRKINVLTEASDFYEIGSKLEIVETKFGNIGLNICSDNYRDAIDIGFVLGRMGADFILSPSSWTVNYDITEENDPYSSKWLEPFSIISNIFEIPVISTTSVGYIVGGPFEGRKMVGCSLATDKKGVLIKGSFNEFSSDIQYIEIPFNENKKLKGTQIGPILRKKGYLK